MGLKYTIIGAASLGFAMLILAASPNVTVAIIVNMLVGSASILYTTSTTSLVQIQTRPDMRGRVLAIQSVLMMGTTPLGSPLLGWIADNLGGRAPLVLGGFASIAAAGVGYIVVSAMRKLRVSNMG